MQPYHVRLWETGTLNVQFCSSQILQTEINPSRAREALCKCSTYSQMSSISNSIPSSFLSRLVIWIVSRCMSFSLSISHNPHLCSAALLTSAAREPSVLLSDTNRHRLIKKHQSSINSPCMSLPWFDWMEIRQCKRVRQKMRAGEWGWWDWRSWGPTALPQGPLGPAVCCSPWHTSQHRWRLSCCCALLLSYHTSTSAAAHCSLLLLRVYLFIYLFGAVEKRYLADWNFSGGLLWNISDHLETRFGRILMLFQRGK